MNSILVIQLIKQTEFLGICKWSFEYLNKYTFLCLYKSLVRSHLDYGDLVWYPVLKKYISMVENVQRRSTRLIFLNYDTCPKSYLHGSALKTCTSS